MDDGEVGGWKRAYQPARRQESPPTYAPIPIPVVVKPMMLVVVATPAPKYQYEPTPKKERMPVLR